MLASCLCCINAQSDDSDSPQNRTGKSKLEYSSKKLMFENHQSFVTFQYFHFSQLSSSKILDVEAKAP